MAVEVPGKSMTFVAGSDLSSSQYFFVKLNSSSQVVPITGATDVPIGIVQNKPVANDGAEVMMEGVSKLVCSAAITAGNLIGASANGRGAAYVSGTGTTNYIQGQALSTCANAGEFISVAFNCLVPNRGA